MESAVDALTGRDERGGIGDSPRSDERHGVVMAFIRPALAATQRAACTVLPDLDGHVNFSTVLHDLQGDVNFSMALHDLQGDVNFSMALHDLQGDLFVRAA